MYTICFVGVEGVGKTWVTQFFAKHFQTYFAIEYGNFYCQTILQGYFRSGTFLTKKDDFVKIVKQQQQIWMETINRSQKLGFCFFDTDLIYTKYFIDKQFKNWNWIDSFLQKQPIDLFIFLKSDQVVIKKDSLITSDTITQETEALLTYYRKWVPPSKLIIIESNDYSQRQFLIKEVIQKHLQRHDL